MNRFVVRGGTDRVRRIFVAYLPKHWVEQCFVVVLASRKGSKSAFLEVFGAIERWDLCFRAGNAAGRVEG